MSSIKRRSPPCWQTTIFRLCDGICTPLDKRSCVVQDQSHANNEGCIDKPVFGLVLFLMTLRLAAFARPCPRCSSAWSAVREPSSLRVTVTLLASNAFLGPEGSLEFGTESSLRDEPALPGCLCLPLAKQRSTHWTQQLSLIRSSADFFDCPAHRR